VDLNADGRLDIITGCWPGELHFFQHMPDKTYKGETIKDRNGKEIKLGSASTVFAADWDSDGDYDLLVGNQQGEVFFVPNEGNAKNYAFGSPRKLQADGKDIQVAHGDSGPVIADWDGDKVLDLIVGCGDGSVVFYRNIGTPKEPKLAAGKSLIDAPKQEPVVAKTDGRGSRAKVCVADFNGDGLADLLVGDFSMGSMEEPNLTPEEKAKKEQVQKRFMETQQKYTQMFTKQRELTQAIVKAEGDAKARLEKELADLRAATTKYLKEEYTPVAQEYSKYSARPAYHGYVWYYQRQTPAR
jgi:hypothetical protein